MCSYCMWSRSDALLCSLRVIVKSQLHKTRWYCVIVPDDDSQKHRTHSVWFEGWFEVDLFLTSLFFLCFSSGPALPLRLCISALQPQRTQPPPDQRLHHQTGRRTHVQHTHIRSRMIYSPLHQLLHPVTMNTTWSRYPGRQTTYIKMNKVLHCVNCITTDTHTLSIYPVSSQDTGCSLYIFLTLQGRGRKTSLHGWTSHIYDYS